MSWSITLDAIDEPVREAQMDQKELNDNPADPRVYFAAEWTLLAWVRTGLAMMGFGFVVARFGLFLRELAAVPGMPHQKHTGFSLWMGTTLVVLALPPGLPLEAIQQISPHLLRSDHAPFWEKGIPAVMWTDTSEFRNPNYHQPTDTPETLDYEFMAEVGKLLAAVVVGQAPPITLPS